MSELSNAETALLGLLSEEPMYPYQIEQQVKYRDMRFWTDLSMSSIYKLLRKLEKEELVVRTDRISTENRLQKHYSVSAKGEGVLREKLLSLLSVSEHMRWQFDLGIYNSYLLPKDKVCAALEAYKEDLQKKIRGYQDLQEFLKGSNCPLHHLAVAVRPVFLLEGEMKWVDDYLAQL